MDFMGKVRSRSGFSVIEVMVAISIMSIMAVGMASLMSAQSKEMENLRTTVTKDNLVNRIRQVLGTPSAILKTGTTVGGMFNTCVSGGAGPTCNFPMNTAPTGISFYDTAGFQISGPGPMPAENTAVPVGTVAFYSSDGVRCPMSTTAPSAQCQIGVVTSYWASVDGNWPDTASENAGAGNSAYEVRMFYDIKLLYHQKGMASITELCNNGYSAALGGVYVSGLNICSADAIVATLPFAGTMSPAAGRVAYWTTTTNLSNSSIKADPIVAVTPVCNGSNVGTLHLDANNNLMACTQRAAGSYGWLTISEGNSGGGLPGSGNYTGTGSLAPLTVQLVAAAHRLPTMVGMYLCPIVSNASPWACGAMPMCHGQIQADGLCCQSTGTPIQCWAPLSFRTGFCNNLAPANCQPLW